MLGLALSAVLGLLAPTRVHADNSTAMPAVVLHDAPLTHFPGSWPREPWRSFEWVKNTEPLSIERIRELQPGIVINSRMHGQADFSTAEVGFPKQRPAGWWEMCAIWNNGGWGHTRGEQYRPTSSVLEEFSRVRAWGGNYLINMGPRPNGELPDVAYQRLAEFGEWMKHSGEAVLDTQAGAWPEDCNVPFTVNGNVRFLLLPPGFQGTVKLNRVSQPKSVQLLRTGETLPFKWLANEQGGSLSLELPADRRSGSVDAAAVALP